MLIRGALGEHRLGAAPEFAKPRHRLVAVGGGRPPRAVRKHVRVTVQLDVTQPGCAQGLDAAELFGVIVEHAGKMAGAVEVADLRR